jgi:hypothetical protein
MARTQQLMDVLQADLVRVTLPLCLSGEVITTPLHVVMLQVFHQIQLLQAHLQSTSAIQIVQQCTLNIVQMVDLPGKQVPEGVRQLKQLAVFHQVQRIKLECELLVLQLMVILDIQIQLQ